MLYYTVTIQIGYQQSQIMCTSGQLSSRLLEHLPCTCCSGPRQHRVSLRAVNSCWSNQLRNTRGS